jgi:hypothetical protein
VSGKLDRRYNLSHEQIKAILRDRAAFNEAHRRAHEGIFGNGWLIRAARWVFKLFNF